MVPESRLRTLRKFWKIKHPIIISPAPHWRTVIWSLIHLFIGRWICKVYKSLQHQKYFKEQHKWNIDLSMFGLQTLVVETGRNSFIIAKHSTFNRVNVTLCSSSPATSEYECNILKRDENPKRNKQTIILIFWIFYVFKIYIHNLSHLKLHITKAIYLKDL